MKQKLNSVLLIDDDESTNFLNELILNEADCTKQIVAVQSGKKALDFIKQKKANSVKEPDLIFLDVNMPAMDGWEFLEEYVRLPKEDRNSIVIVMLTTSLNPDDEERAKTYSEVNGFCHKPLTFEILQSVMHEHFDFTEDMLDKLNADS